MYYVLVIFKAERAIFGIYVLGCVLAYVVCNTLVKKLCHQWSCHFLLPSDGGHDADVYCGGYIF